MIRDILTNKWCIGGIGFLILFCIGCYLWFQHETISYRKQAEESDEILRRWKMSQNKQDSVPVKKQSDTVDNETFQEKRISVSQEMEVNPNIMSKKTSEVPLKTPLETDETDTTEEVPVSRFGFGPYPKTPEGMTFIPWERLPSANHELMRRVRIKLWEDGIRTDGAVIENGLIYPTVRGRVYLQEGGILSHPDDNIQVDRGRLPDLSGYDVYSFDDGIEPYSFLNIEREAKNE